MSAETFAAFEEALAAHVADSAPGHVVSGYVLEAHIVDFTDDADTRRSRYFRIYPPNQPYHETYGLLITAQDDHVADGIVTD